MQNIREVVIGLFVVWCVAATYWYTVVHNKLSFANQSEIIDNHILEILLIIAVSFILGYLLHKSVCEAKHFTTTLGTINNVVNNPNVQKSTKDDLKVVEGIGPAIEKLLNKEGIHTYWQLAETPVSKLLEILTKAGPLYLNHGENTWNEQAALLRDGKMEEFKKMAEKLIGGNRVA